MILLVGPPCTPSNFEPGLHTLDPSKMMHYDGDKDHENDTGSDDLTCFYAIDLK